MKLAVLTMRLFDQPRTGGELCTARLLRGLQLAGHQLTVIGLGQGPSSPTSMSAGSARHVSVGDWMPAYADLPALQRLTMPLQAVAAGRPVSTQRLNGAGSAARVRRQLLDELAALDGLVVDHLQSLDWVRALLPQLPRPMVVMHNLEADGYLERARGVAGRGAGARISRWVLQREARLLRRMEHLALQHASVVGCLTEADAARLRELAARNGRPVPVEVLPGYTLPATVSCATAPEVPPIVSKALPTEAVRATLAALPPGQRRVGMLGTWTWEPNRAGLDWMLQHVLPRLPAHCQLVLAGAGLEHLPPHPRTTVLGRIAEVGSFYEAVDLVAIPSVRGSGIHEKAIEAIGGGMPVVASRHGLRGLMQQLPGHVHLADSADEFAQACATVPTQADPVAGRAWAAERQHNYQEVLHRCLGWALQPRHAAPPVGTEEAHGAAMSLAGARR